MGLLDLLMYLLLGLIQGLTEVFPVSSSAHVALTSRLMETTFGISGFPFEVAIFLHLGTFFSILLYYQKDIVGLWHSFTSSLVKTALRPSTIGPSAATEDLSPRIPYLMLISLCVTGILGLLLRTTAKLLFEESMFFPGLLILNGLIIIAVARLFSGNKKIEEIGLVDYIIIGLAQGVAVLPGISRLGMTLCAGLMRGLSWFEALKLSYLLSLPMVLAASAISLDDYSSLDEMFQNINFPGLLAGIAVAAGAGFIAIRLILSADLHAKRHLANFGLYCLVVGSFFLFFFQYLS